MVFQPYSKKNNTQTYELYGKLDYFPTSPEEDLSLGDWLDAKQVHIIITLWHILFVVFLCFLIDFLNMIYIIYIYIYIDKVKYYI